MKRRSFIKNGLLFIPTVSIFVPKLLKAQSGLLKNPSYVATLKAQAAGGGGGSCPADGSPSIDQSTQDNAQRTGGDDDYFYVGDKWTDASTRQICKVRFYLGLNAGSVTSKFYTCRIYTLTGTALNTVVTNGQSNSVAGSDAWSNTAVYFTFSGNPSLTGGTTYARVVYVSDASGNPVASNSTNNIQTYFKETTNPLANSAFTAWNTVFAENFAFGGNSDGKGSVYWFA